MFKTFSKIANSLIFYYPHSTYNINLIIKEAKPNSYNNRLEECNKPTLIGNTKSS